MVLSNGRSPFETQMKPKEYQQKRPLLYGDNPEEYDDFQSWNSICINSLTFV